MSTVYLPGGWFVSTKKDQSGAAASVYIGLCTIGPRSPRYLSSKERACAGERLTAAINAGDLDGPYDTREDAMEWLKPPLKDAPAPVEAAPAPAPAPASTPPPPPPAPIEIDDDSLFDVEDNDDPPPADQVATSLVPAPAPEPELAPESDPVPELEPKAVPVVAPPLEDDKTILDGVNVNDLPF